ncbi:DNA-binding SARP family transcriptional activator/DNA-binding XRE family transcriptional regulator [Lipingzhangella halophila]|uniref:DNA-binding SARP family transcriptional activator/DNA-binding XRE family transcriptional regulator n=1 Tax=Lipingzhangella halophila TaxID=1783352 RepID=A0A7W7RMU2_9ACTN|nr:BTAD domain-containing putative transcriptional regulator [Lipingzhangella halophila]MBB4934493.1 DNA-binding SARP family transcriptional activator/DNA-binding XRE family transcriptional regulator [Lipingzhangella halophila]
MRAEDVAGMVQEARRRAGLTQREAARLAGLSVAGLRDVEQGRVTRPRESTLRRLAYAMGLSLAETHELIRAGSRDAGPRVRVDLLGPLRVLVDGHPVDPGPEPQRVLLGLLALSPNTTVGRDTLAKWVWDTRPPATAAESMQSRVSRLRRRMRPQRPHTEADRLPALVAADGGYRLVVPDDQLDLVVFYRLVDQARRADSSGDRAGAHELFERALGLWRGAPLADLHRLHSHPGVVALTRERHKAVVEYAANAAALGRNKDALPLLQEVADAEPLHEEAHAALMVALAGSGQQAAALAVFDTLRRRLADELGAVPGPELTHAHQRVLRQNVSARPEPISAHRQLPPDIAEFTGRATELRALRDILAGPPGDRPTVCCVNGMAGVGKTRLAVHAAHQLTAAGHFADVQLYADLGGHSAQPPADPAAVLDSFLRTLGVPNDRLPRSLDERTEVYRERLRYRNALVLLDNVASAEQIAPLLPASPTNTALITGRRALELGGAHTLPLGVFSAADARDLLSTVVGGSRVAAAPDDAEAIVRLCGRHPLAVALAARRLRARPAWTMADLANRLTADRLGELGLGGRRLTATFDLSYSGLTPDERRMFHMLALHPGADLSGTTAAALAGISSARAGSLLDRLVRERLLAVNEQGRYELPCLVDEYARQTAERAESEATREAAITRLLDYYLHTAARAAAFLLPDGWSPELVGGPPAEKPALETFGEAKLWLAAERADLASAVVLATAQSRWGHAWQLADTIRRVWGSFGAEILSGTCALSPIRPPRPTAPLSGTR